MEKRIYNPEKKIDIVDIIDKIEIHNPENSHPTIEISDATNDYFENFRNAVDNVNDEDKGIFAIIRCWNKDENSVKTLFNEINTIKESLPALKGIIIAINNDNENNNTTENSIGKVLEIEDLKIPVLPLKINKYTWTSGLNSGISLLNEIAKNDGVDLKNISLLNMSFDVSIEKDELLKMKELLNEQDYILTIRNTSEKKSPFSNKSNEMWNKFKQLLKNPMQSNLFELVYAMRNTFNIIPMNELVELGGYNPICDGKDRSFVDNEGNVIDNISVKGMEDSEFFMRLILKNIGENKHGVLKQIKRAMETPIAYNDPSWQRIGEIDRFKKISNETDALVKITSGIVHSKIRSTDLKISGSSQDFKI